MQKIIRYLRNSWAYYDSVSTIGYTYIGNTLLKHEEFSRFLSNKSMPEILSFLIEANGLFAIVKDTGEGLLAVVDRIRSIPLFYAVEDDRIFISDDAYWISEQLACDRYDDISMLEFLSLGCVTGEDTLYPKIKQIKAGNSIFVKEINGRIQVDTERYYRFLRHDYFSEPEEDLQKKWDEVVIRTFDRMIRTLEGRTVVVPLSGGYDSRLVAITLKRLGYENVICFSYGSPSSLESEISCKVAKKLGYQWEFVPYTHNLWNKWYHSEEARSYIRLADGLSSVAFIQDWPAVWEMKKHGVIPKESVFVPGHNLSFISGTRLLTELVNEKVSGLEELVSYIMRKNYVLWDLHRLYNWVGFSTSIDRLRQKMEERIITSIRNLRCNTVEDAANIFEYWYWQESQAKFYSNTVRVYEFWDYEWRMPYWDLEVMTFWERIPLKYRLGRKLRNRYVELIQKKYGIDAVQQSTMRPSKDIKRLLISAHLYRPELIASVKRLPYRLPLLSQRKRLHAYNDHPLCWYGIMPKEKFLSLYSGRENINSFLALERLGITNF
jgi:asparagine synthase (glutamine-hydrolysing)